MDQYCDLFIMPYNYILDIDLLERFSKMIANSILIFDEAHNVADASCEGRSY
jgi:Rad3-related DNA helicase